MNKLFTWSRQNLFSSVLNTVLTLLVLYGLYKLIPPVVHWALIDAHWQGDSSAACSGEGACWVFIKVRFSQFIYGFYPASEYWRVNLAFLMLAGLIIALLLKSVPQKKWIAAFTLLIYPIIAFYLFHGGLLGLKVVETDQWGGLMLTLILAIVGIVLSLPLGILLALGRRSEHMPIVKAFCVVFIEFWRGVPLITVLFMASVMLPLFLPEHVDINKLMRALIGIVLFESAYMAEVIRGGLQTIPKGQYEAAQALGLGYWQSMIGVILPQALKLVIPGIVNTLIALFKDTTLVLIIGLMELLAMIEAALADPNWLGFWLEGLVFAGFMYWLFCFSMSRYSQHLEHKLHSGHKRN